MRQICILLLLIFSCNIGYAQNQSLLEAVQTKDKLQIKRLIAKGINPNETSITGFSALMAAACTGDIDVLELLLNAGANVNQLSLTGESALLYAVMSGNAPCVQVLMKHGANPHEHSKIGVSPISMARTLQNKQILAMLTQGTENANSPSSQGESIFLPLNDATISKAQKDARKIKPSDDWNLKIAYFVGSKSNDRLLEQNYTHRVQIITPYTLLRGLAFKAEHRYQKLNPDVIETLRQYPHIIWIWVWNIGKAEQIGASSIAPSINHVVIKQGSAVIQPLDRFVYVPELLFAQNKIPLSQIWPFRADTFSSVNEHPELILVDIRDRKHVLKLTPSTLKRICEQ